MHNKRLIITAKQPLLIARVTALIAILAFTLSGCANYGSAYLLSNPPGVEVINLEDDSILGTTPVKVWWRDTSKKPKHVNVRFQKQGYLDKFTAFWVNMRHSSRNTALENAVPVKVQLKKEGTR